MEEWRGPFGRWFFPVMALVAVLPLLQRSHYRHEVDANVLLVAEYSLLLVVCIYFPAYNENIWGSFFRPFRVDGAGDALEAALLEEGATVVGWRGRVGLRRRFDRVLAVEGCQVAVEQRPGTAVVYIEPGGDVEAAKAFVERVLAKTSS